MTNRGMARLALLSSSLWWGCEEQRAGLETDAGAFLLPLTLCVDNDGDGVPGTGDCRAEPPVDCDDLNPSVFPGARERCNGRDDDCDGEVDETLARLNFYLDEDRDGIGGAKVGEGCGALPAGTVTMPGDCNDADPAVRPGVPERCNGVDDDCDGRVDDGLSARAYSTDADGDGYGDAASQPVYACGRDIPGRVTNGSDCDDTRADVKPGGLEVCNGRDDDCNGTVDDGLPSKQYFEDSDGDGYGSFGSTARSACAPLAGWVADSSDCNDAVPSIRPGAIEACNGVDENCDGRVDEGLATRSFFPDADGDGFGADGVSATLSCRPALAGHVARAGDCNDTSPATHPGAVETCNGVDDDCNGVADDAVASQRYYPDADGDGYGAATATPLTSCSAIAGRVTNADDCNDADPAVKPSAVELCNGVDDNCKGGVDEGNPGGGAACGTGRPGACGPGSYRCSAGGLTCVANQGSAAELCDGVDNNCDGAVDEAFPSKGQACTVGKGVCARTGVTVCAPSKTGVECDATPGAPSAPACDGLDNDCDGAVDEPALAQTDDVSTASWTDVEVQPFFYSAGGCAGGVNGAGADALVGGGMVMAGGASGIWYQRLDTLGAPVGAPSKIAEAAYSEVAMAQAGAGFLVAALFNDGKEIDLFYVDGAAGTHKARRTGLFRGASDEPLDSLRVVRAAGRRAVVVWREAGTGIKLARVEACLSATDWSLKAPGCASSPAVPSKLVVAQAGVFPGIGADAALGDWGATQDCPPTSAALTLGIAYAPSAAVVHLFTVNEDGTSKTADEVVASATGSTRFAEPEVGFFRDASGGGQWAVASVRRDTSTPPQADLSFWLSNDKTWHWLYSAPATQQGAESIRRPRLSATATSLWFSALRYLTAAEEPSSYKRQVMTRVTDLTGARVPLGSAVESSASGGACVGTGACRAGDKDALTNWAPFGRVYYSGKTSAPLGTWSSTLSCN